MDAELRSFDLAEFDGEICVVGADAAAITVARRLLSVTMTVWIMVGITVTIY